MTLPPARTENALQRAPCNSMQQHRGFTLLEVLAALVLLAMLVSVVLPVWSRITQSESQLNERFISSQLLHHFSQDDLARLLADGTQQIDNWQVSCTALSGGINDDQTLDTHSIWLKLEISSIQQPAIISASALRLLYRPAEKAGNNPDSKGQER